MTDLADLVTRNLLEVFNQRDDAARRTAAAELWTPDIRFSDHDGVAAGTDAVDEKVEQLQARTPGFEFRVAGPVHEVQELATLDWDYGPAGEEPVVSGTDVVLVRDGRIAALYTYLTKTPTS